MFEQTWWNSHAEANIDQFKEWVGDENAQSKKYIRFYLTRNPYTSFLDVGCGNATLYEPINNHLKIQYTGVDSCKFFIDSGLKQGINIIDSDVRHMECIADSSYDFGFSRHVFEHQESFKPALSELIRVSKCEACHIFFIKPLDVEKISFDENMNLYHNIYSTSDINTYLNNNKKVASWSWASINDKEIALHIILHRDDATKTETNNSIN
jgi:ubiquinone/menaquinone biosynthesis C-methylase UbiE